MGWSLWIAVGILAVIMIVGIVVIRDAITDMDRHQGELNENLSIIARNTWLAVPKHEKDRL